MTKSQPKAKRSAEPTEAAAEGPVGQALSSCKHCARWKEVKDAMGIVGVLGKAVQNFEEKLSTKDFQPTVSEFLKLIQFEQEFEKELNPPEEIRVTWVEPATESNISK